MNVPLAALPLTAVSTSSFGVTCRVPGVGGGDDEGDGDGDGDGGGEDGAGADDRTSPVTCPDPRWTCPPRTSPRSAPPMRGSACGSAMATRPPGSTPHSRRTRRREVAAAQRHGRGSGRCGPPAISSAAIPATTTATATAATPAAARGCRRTSCHHRGPGGMIGLGNPVRPNGPARCVTLTRWARPVGVLSAQALSTRSRRSPGGLTSGSAASGPAGGVGREPGRPDLAQAFVPRDRVQPGPSWSGSRSPWSLAAAMIKVSATASAASAGGAGRAA